MNIARYTPESYYDSIKNKIKAIETYDIYKTKTNNKHT